MSADPIERQLGQLRPAVVDDVLARWEGAAALGPTGRLRCEEDVAYHLENLAAAIALDSPGLFAAYAAWVRDVLAARGLPASCLDVALDAIAGRLEAAPLADGHRAVAREALAAARAPGAPASPAPPLVAPEAFVASVRGDRRVLLELVARWQAERGAGYALRQLAALQQEVGEAWLRNAITVAQEHRATALVQLALSTLAPYTAGAPGPRPQGRAVVACAPGDWHGVGPRIAADLLELAGYEVEFLGANTPVEHLVNACAEVRPALVGIGVAPIAALPSARAAADAVRAALPGVRVLVGGRAARIAGADALGATLLAPADFDGRVA